MTSRAGGDLVAVRATVVATLSLVTAAVAHVTAGGLLPSALWLAGLLVLAVASSAALLAREASRARIVILLVAGQTGIHLALTLLAGHAGDHHHHGEVSVVERLVDALTHTAHDLVADTPMVLTHLAAAALTGLLLARGERLLWAVLALLARAAAFVALVLHLPVAPATFPAPRRPHLLADAAPRRTALVVVSTHVRRGPPALLAA